MHRVGCYNLYPGPGNEEGFGMANHSHQLDSIWMLGTAVKDFLDQIKRHRRKKLLFACLPSVLGSKSIYPAAAFLH